MAFASVGTGGTSLNTNNNQSSSSHTVATNNLTAGRLGVLIISVDNNQTTDGDENAVSSVADSTGVNTWSKGIEYCNGNGAAQAGATVSIWYCLAASNLDAGGSITWNFSNNSSRDESCSSLWIFSVGAGSTVAVEGTPAGLAGDAADAASLDVTTSNIECLRVRGIAAELNSATQMTATSGGAWTLFSNTRSANTAAAMAVYGEHRIVTATNAASDPALPSNCDHASGYIAFREVIATGHPTAKRAGGVGFMHSASILKAGQKVWAPPRLWLPQHYRKAA